MEVVKPIQPTIVFDHDAMVQSVVILRVRKDACLRAVLRPSAEAAPLQRHLGNSWILAATAKSDWVVLPLICREGRFSPPHGH